MAVLVNPINYSGTVEADPRQVRSAAKTLGLETIHILEASTENDLDVAFSNLVQRRAGGLVISADTFFSGQSAHSPRLRCAMLCRRFRRIASSSLLAA